MKAIFYDRKNKREVGSDQLMRTNFVQFTVAVDNDGAAPGSTVSQLRDQELYIVQTQLGDLGYKSEDCPKEQNWDLSLMENDLIFLRMEE